MADKYWRFKPGNQERERIASAARYQKNKARLGELRKARYAANRDKELARNKAWTLRNIEKHRALNRQWSKSNPIESRALVARRRAMRAAAEGHYSASDVRGLFAQQHGLCAACQCDISARYEVDHIMPLIAGGSNWPDNLQLLCMPCNRSKSYKLPGQWVRACSHGIPEGQ